MQNEMNTKRKEGTEAAVLGPILFQLYGRVSSGSLRGLLRRLTLKLEGGELFSVTIRRIFAHYHQREVGMYSGGAALLERSFPEGPPGVSIGRYTSLARGMQAFNADHPVGRKSTHAIFYHPAFGFSQKELLDYTRLTIGNDVWVGHNVTILSSVSSIGDGAVIAAGSVVFRNVPPYAIVGGYPARIIRYRFSEKTIGELLASKWWEKSMHELRANIEEFQRPLEEEPSEEKEAGALLRA